MNITKAPRRPSRRAAHQHDLYCRAALSDLQVVDELLRLFLAIEIGPLIEQGPPTLEHGNHVDEDSRASRPDFRFTYPRKGGGRVKIVLEHKSWPDLGTPAQLCRYAASALDPREREVRDLIFLAALYHGEGDWTVPGTAEPGSAPLPLGALVCLLLNLMRLDLDALASRVSRKTWVAVTAMVGAFNAEVRAAHLNGLLLALPESGAFTRQTLKYISGAWDLDKDALDAILVALRPEEGGTLMGNTLWDIEERAERRAEQRAERRAQAKYLAQGKADSLLAQLRLKFNGLPDEAARKVRAASVEQLDVWLAAILTAADIDEFLAAKP